MTNTADQCPAETCIECGHDEDVTHGSYEPEGFICDDCYW